MQARYTDYKILLTINKYQTYVEFETTFFFKSKNKTKFSLSDSVIFDFDMVKDLQFDKFSILIVKRLPL